MRSALPSAVSWVVLESATHFSCFSNPLACREQSVMFVGGSLASVRGSHSSTDVSKTAHNRFSFLCVFASVPSLWTSHTLRIFGLAFVLPYPFLNSFFPFLIALYFILHAKLWENSRKNKIVNKNIGFQLFLSKSGNLFPEKRDVPPLLFFD